MDKPDLISSATGMSLSASEEQALEEFTLKANQWRLTEDSMNLMHQLAMSSSSSFTSQPSSSARSSDAGLYSSSSHWQRDEESGSSSSGTYPPARPAAPPLSVQPVTLLPTPGVLSKPVALKFLMARKFHVQRALELYRQYQVVRHMEGLDNLDPYTEPLRTELHSGKFTVLETKDATIAVLTGRLHNSDTARGARERSVTLQSILFQLDAALCSRDTQRNGLVLLYDMSGVRWANSDMKLARHLLDILKGGFPARLKKILIVDAPSWLQVPFRLIRPFMTAKMLERLYVISSSQLVDHIPLQSLPESVGGQHKHHHDKWLQTCLLRMAANNEDAIKKPRPLPPLPLLQPLGSRNGHIDDDPMSQGGIGRKDVVEEMEATLEESKAAMTVSVHRRSDKGMGVIPFIQLIRSMGKAGILKEYDMMRTAARALPDSNFTTFRLPENRVKNRYIDVPCFEWSRVKLMHRPPGEDYIHANFVDGYEQKNAFISTQGPMPKTFPDFWLMVWERECRVLVMTTRTVERAKQKCGQYWPAESGESMQVGDMTITSQAVIAHLHHMETRLLLTSKTSEEQRQIVHLQFTDWPDYGVPHSASSMFEFIRVMRQCQKEAVASLNPRWSGHGNGPPIVVHCSAGIGRSGTLCALDICMERVDDCGLLNVHQSVQKLRSQRCQSIQMPEQYLFCYLALLEYCVEKGLVSHQEANLESFIPWLQEDDE